MNPQRLLAPERTDRMVAPLRWFARTYALAVVAHLVGNPVGWRSDVYGGSPALTLVGAALGVSALILLVRPDARVLGAAAALTLVSLGLEMPVTGNHWLLMGFVALATLVSLTRTDPWSYLSVTGRWILLAFYSFAAFAKLNSGFLDPDVSCGVFYANQSLDSFGLPTFDGGPLSVLAIAGPVLTELSVPVLLAFSRTRRAGVLLALTFHSIISLDLDQHFYDFTATLVVLLCLFLPEDTTSDLEARAVRPSRIRDVVLALTPFLILASVLPPMVATAVILKLVSFIVWVPVATWLVVRIAQHGLGPAPLSMRLPGVAPAVIVALVVANALSPYLEVKSSTGFNMYANLVTVSGETNHLVVPGTLHLSHVQDDMLEVVSSEVEALDVYASENYLVPERNLLDYLARHPDASVVVRDATGERTLDGSDGVRMSLVSRKLLPFRAVDAQDPPRCQSQWFPAL
ncbi:hypothetical protein ACFQW6_08395 [Nocardioides sp. GCM10028917]|uniref:hypothetical protein n=1 Tax=Nocardioides sp. GCM10028917 TaxID=3273408 RepID=UPI0036132F62